MAAASFLARLLLVFFIALPCAPPASSIQDVDVENPILHLHPAALFGSSPFVDAKDIILCERIRVAGFSRFNIKRYANTFQVTLRPSELIHERHHRKIDVCLHTNASIALCECAKDEWQTLQNGVWSSVMAPFGDRYIDVRFASGLSGSITASLEEELHHWHLICLGLGFIFLLLAPFMSEWVPFYYGSSMAIGVLLVVLVILFQGMKLLPAGKKNIFYLTIYGSVLGAGSYLVQHFAMLVNSILVNFGLTEEMHNPVSVFLLVGICLFGAALGYWIVRKFVLSDDGTVDVAIAQFVKWAMRLIAMVFIFESTLDVILAVATLSLCWCICSVITTMALWIPRSTDRTHSVNRKLWKQRALQASVHHKRTEIQKKYPNMSLVKTAPRKKPTSPCAWSTSPRKEMVLSSNSKPMAHQQDYYSSFHKMPHRKKFSRKGWDKFTDSSTREALAALASSPEFTDWLADRSDHIRLVPSGSSEDDMYSGSDSEGEMAMEEESGISLFKWH